ncbi:hypothetical protein KA344_14105 [bacterium]|jgi:hypothetical protein|nr:hypothetical protein [bacterium]
MTLTLLAGLLVVANLGLTAAIFWLRYQSNKQLFNTSAPLKPIATKRRFFGHFNGVYDALDRVPLLRRSGTANELDLLKALTLVSVPYLIFNLVMNQASLLVWLLCFGVMLTLVNIIVLAHPVTKKLVSGK